MQALVENLTIFMIVGVVVVVAISQINRLIGSILGMIFWVSVALIGREAYARGGAIGLPGMPFKEWVFYLVCAVLFVVNAATLFQALKRRRGPSTTEPP